jgi:hypothetical protein
MKVLYLTVMSLDPTGRGTSTVNLTVPVNASFGWSAVGWVNVR